GASVLRMVEQYVGADVFKKGINAYLQEHAYGNATSRDFWTAIAKTSGLPVDRILPTFVNQPGAPLLDVSLRCEGGRAALSVRQQRFFVDAALLAAPSAERWQVPVCVKSSARPSAQCTVVDGSAEIPIEGSACPDWAFVNAGAQGYYRTSYTPDMIRA